MKKHLLTFLICITTLTLSAQQLQSPEAFLDYKIGSRFTPHYKIVNYVKAVAQALPRMVKVEPYGETYEGRELLLVFVSSSQNMQRLDEIRQNNIALAGMNKSTASAENAPAIVWLSYNVHGNEPSSSEAAMATLYELVNPANTQTKEWLKNTVVVIDPCMNPDGRDRYVNWFNSVSGSNPNADVQSREHAEPWPGGRGNHYNFDLNRDWAWQTQIETQQRLAKYNQWLPQVHVDFHEQYFNNPYYFAPAAEPYHQVITSWQREFQKTIGKNNAKYFDENGWLYFTRQEFDLFYPSYGDTYPLYNGAIGMTYEQGGHSRGGLAVVTNAGDTLTLEDRLKHHVASGLSTIEAASQHAQKLVAEFKKFYDNSRNNQGDEVKTYVITSDNSVKLNTIANLLKSNSIEYGTVTGKDFKGVSFETGKEEKAKLKKYNIAISTAQPKSVLAKVLLEPKSNLADSITYDITAWSLPYAYNVDAYAVRDALPLKPFTTSVDKAELPLSNYGYLIRYNSINAVKLLCRLLKQNVKIRYAEKPFTYNGKQYDRGTLIVLEKGNPVNLGLLLKDFLSNNVVEIDAVTTGFMEKGPDFGSADIKFIRAPKVALITGQQASSSAAGEVWHLFDRQLEYPLTLIDADDLGNTNLSNYNVLIIPDGYYSSLSGKNVADKLREFVSSGGRLIAMENAVQQLSTSDWGIKVKETTPEEKDKDKPDYSLLKRYENRERDEVSKNIPGAIYNVQLDNSHPLAFGYSDSYYTLRRDTVVYDFMKDGWNVGYIKKDNYVAGFTGSRIKKKINDGLVFGVTNTGLGAAVFLADDPLFRGFWEGGKLLFCNAVFLVGQ